MTMTDTNAGTSLLPFESIDCPPAIVLFQTGEDDLDHLIDRIEAEVMAEHCDVNISSGRERERHLAAKVTRSKTHLDAMGKDLTEEHRRIVDGINARRRIVRSRLDDIAARRRANLTAWEEKEEARKRHVASVIAFFREAADPRMGTSLDDLRDLLGRVRAADVTDDVFSALEMQQAMQARDHADTCLTHLIESEEQRIEAEKKAAEDRARMEAEVEAARAEAEQQRQAAEAEIAKARQAAESEIAKARQARESEIAKEAEAEKAAQPEPEPVVDDEPERAGPMQVAACQLAEAIDIAPHMAMRAVEAITEGRVAHLLFCFGANTDGEG